MLEGHQFPENKVDDLFFNNESSVMHSESAKRDTLRQGGPTFSHIDITAPEVKDGAILPGHPDEHNDTACNKKNCIDCNRKKHWKVWCKNERHLVPWMVLIAWYGRRSPPTIGSRKCFRLVAHCVAEG